MKMPKWLQSLAEAVCDAWVEDVVFGEARAGPPTLPAGRRARPPHAACPGRGRGLEFHRNEDRRYLAATELVRWCMGRGGADILCELYIVGRFLAEGPKCFAFDARTGEASSSSAEPCPAL